MDKKKRVAAVSAVVAYIKSQEEAACHAAMAGMEPGDRLPDPVSQPGTGFQTMNAWGTSGRQAQMNGRFLMQMRAFR